MPCARGSEPRLVLWLNDTLLREWRNSAGIDIHLTRLMEPRRMRAPQAEGVRSVLSLWAVVNSARHVHEFDVAR